MHKDPGFSTPSPTLGIVCLFAYRQPGGCEVVSLCDLNPCVPDSSWCQQHCAFTAGLGFDLFSKGLANLFSEGPDSKWGFLAACDYCHVCLFPPTPLKKNVRHSAWHIRVDVLGFFCTKTSREIVRRPHESIPAAHPLWTCKRSPTSPGNVGLVGPHRKNKGRAPGSLAVRVPEVSLFQPHCDSSPDELIRVPGMKPAHLSPTAE